MRFLIAAALALGSALVSVSIPAHAQPVAARAAPVPLPVGLPRGNAVVAPILAEAGPGTRWGMVVADDTGQEIVAINPEGRFIPASNTKLFTTAAALWAEAHGQIPGPSQPATTVALWDKQVVLTGGGDARLSSKADCVTACLATLADAVAAKTRRVRGVIGDAHLFPDQRWSPGMSWNNIPSSSGTAVAALTVDDNEIEAKVAPGVLGAAPVIALPAYYRVDNRATTVAGDGDTLAYDRAPNGRVLVVTGTLGIAHAPLVWRLGVDDPAGYAAWRLADMLRARGVRIAGDVRGAYCADPAIGAAARNVPARCGMVSGRRSPVVLARIDPPAVATTVSAINKPSQNLHAELLLRRIGLAQGAGSIPDGQAMVTAMLAEAGVGPGQVSLSDGSGMSSYNRVAPRATVSLLRFAARQPWGATLRDSLPVGGVDGTLRRRFAGTPLEGRIFAKTGTLNATNALAGWLVAASGRTLTFAIYANDVPEDVRATAIMDRALVAFAAVN